MQAEGVPGNCPDHDGLVASVATGAEPDVYGTDPSTVIEVLFTNKQAANEHLTTEAQVEAALKSGDAIPVDLGTTFDCAVVPAQSYRKGSPLG